MVPMAESLLGLPFAIVGTLPHPAFPATALTHRHTRVGTSAPLSGNLTGLMVWVRANCCNLDDSSERQPRSSRNGIFYGKQRGTLPRG
jgi:hypothetical protein